jgi:hypothetical protein
MNALLDLHSVWLMLEQQRLWEKKYVCAAGKSYEPWLCVFVSEWWYENNETNIGLRSSLFVIQNETTCILPEPFWPLMTQGLQLKSRKYVHFKRCRTRLSMWTRPFFSVCELRGNFKLWFGIQQWNRGNFCNKPKNITLLKVRKPLVVLYLFRK